ncbi:MAG: hypothetical protein EPO51_23575 [Phenylobacterium sp.]|uniref:phosphatase PAP2 family protein n=1 Tax=Phenylobacterium sp. TaxID=1871053 RepID=UPI0012039128|nr:phosphatase PAP2 family protein [Phenylobacterium sp.]TAJ69242.1 MAG: hypothetical protein EPO51_23575 [Phenylobacterium sp.]
MSVQSQGNVQERLSLSLPGLGEVIDELRHDRALYLAMAAYIATAAGLAYALGKGEHLLALSYAPRLLRSALAAGLVALLVIEVPRAIAAAPGGPLRQLAVQAGRRVTPRLIAGLVLFTAVSLFYGAFTTIKTLLPSLAPFGLDPWAAHLDAALHGGHDPWRLLQPVLGHHAVTRAIQFLYLPVWTTSLCALTAALATSRRLAHLRTRFYWTFLVAWIVLGNVMAAVVMTGGPVYYGHLTGDTARFAPLLSYLDFSRGLPLSSVDVQAMLWSAYANNAASLGSGISAFPSLHVAMATLFALAARHIHWGLGLAYAAFAVAIAAGSVHLGWHYAIDGYASALTVAAVWWAAGRLLRRPQSAVQM